MMNIRHMYSCRVCNGPTDSIYDKGVCLSCHRKELNQKMSPEVAEYRLRKYKARVVEQGCIREACEQGWIASTKNRAGEFQVTWEDVLARWTK